MIYVIIFMQRTQKTHTHTQHGGTLPFIPIHFQFSSSFSDHLSILSSPLIETPLADLLCSPREGVSASSTLRVFVDEEWFRIDL